MVSNLDGKLLHLAPFLTLTFMTQRTGQKLRHLGNLLGCRDGEIDTPSPSPPEADYDDSQVWYQLLSQPM
jgi:hypothetical protein